RDGVCADSGPSGRVGAAVRRYGTIRSECRGCQDRPRHRATGRRRRAGRPRGGRRGPDVRAAATRLDDLQLERMRMSTLVIAIDGPSGSGKSSTARGVAERLGFAYLDTGAMYRAMTWALLQRGIDVA